MIDLNEIVKANKPKVIDNFLSDEDINNLSHVCSFEGLNTLEIERWRWQDESVIHYGDWNISEEEFLESFKKKNRNAQFNIQNIKPLIKNSDNLFFNYTSDDEQQGHWIWWSDKNNITQLHTDPYDNFILQLYGEKEWILFSEEYNEVIYDNPVWDGGYGFAVSDLNINDIDIPHHKLVCKPGQLLFIPKGWSHHVKTLSKSYSINCFFEISKREVLYNYLIKSNIDIEVFKNNNVYLVGGSILRLFMGSPLDTDLDFYVESEENYKNVSKYFDDNFDFQYDTETFRSYKCNSNEIQLINKFQPIDEFIGNFDFTIIKSYFSFKDEKFVFHKRFFDDIKNKKLVYDTDNSPGPLSSMRRADKFKKLGFEVDDESFKKLYEDVDATEGEIGLDLLSGTVKKKSWLRNEDVYPIVPNIDVFVNWLMDIKDHPNLKKFNVYLWGGFISRPYETKDIDVLITKRDGQHATLKELEKLMVDMFDSAYDTHRFFLDTHYMRIPQWIGDYPRDREFLKSVEKKQLFITITKNEDKDIKCKHRRYGLLNCSYTGSFTLRGVEPSSLVHRWVDLNGNYAQMVDLRRIIKYYENNKERDMEDFLNKFQEYSGY